MSDLNAKPESDLAAAEQLAAGALSAADEDAAMADWASALAEQNGNDEINPAAGAVFQPLSKVARDLDAQRHRHDPGHSRPDDGRARPHQDRDP
ncbi:hypothetical protein OKW42_005592 [Paraburkholderia sp. WC7.3d]